MRREPTLAVALIAAIVLFSASPLQSQESFGPGAGGAQAQARKFIAPTTQVVAIRAGQLFDSRSGTMLANQVDDREVTLARRSPQAAAELLGEDRG